MWYIVTEHSNRVIVGIVTKRPSRRHQVVDDAGTTRQKMVIRGHGVGSSS